MNQEQAVAFRAHNDAQPDVTVTLDLIPDTVMMEQVGQVEAALRLAYTALKATEWAAPDCQQNWECPVCHACRELREPHRADCDLAASLAAIRALLPDVGGEEEKGEG